jgi:hypothetical protein
MQRRQYITIRCEGDIVLCRGKQAHSNVIAKNQQYGFGLRLPVDFYPRLSNLEGPYTPPKSKIYFGPSLRYDTLDKRVHFGGFVQADLSGLLHLPDRVTFSVQAEVDDTRNGIQTPASIGFNYNW